MLRRMLLVLALLPAAVHPPLRAQEGDAGSYSRAVPVGSRIRVLTPDIGPVAGVFLDLRADTLLLGTGHGVTLRRSTHALLGIEASEGVRRSTGTGAAVGLAVGAIGGALVVGAACSATYDCPVRLVALAYGAAAGVVGAGLGAGIGSSIRRETWRPVRIEELTPARRVPSR
jgi:hypothetical protein